MAIDKIYEGKTRDEIIELVYTFHLQNTNGRETEDEMFKLGIEACYDELCVGECSDENAALPIQHVSSRFNLVADVMPARNEYVLIKTPYCKYPATVGFWNGVKWLAVDDKCEIFNVSEWLSLNGC